MDSVWITFCGAKGRPLTWLDMAGTLALLYAKANLPTKETSPRTRAWFSCAQKPPEWPQRIKTPSPQGPQARDRPVAMLPRGARLHTERDITRVLRQGLRRTHPFLQVTLSAGATRVSRAAVVVSKQVAKRATDRNRLRRQVQAVLPKALALLPMPVDAIVRLLPPAAKAKRNDLIAALRITWPTHVPPHAPRSSHRR